MADIRHRLRDIGSGLSTGAYLIAVPITVTAVWSRPTSLSYSALHFGLGVVLVLWSYIAVRLAVAVIGEARGRVQTGGIAWLAGAIISVASFVVPTWASAATPSPPKADHSLLALSPISIPVALAAKRRRDELAQLRTVLNEGDIEADIDILRQRNDGFLYALIRLIGESTCGRVTISDHATANVMTTSRPTVVVPVSYHADHWTMAHAQVGTRLDLPPTVTPDDLRRTAIALHPRGRVIVSTSLIETLQALVLRDDEATVVVHAGIEDVDPAIAEKCVVASTSAAPSVVISLLGPTAEIHGLVSPLDSDVRRKCTEMLAYLATHPSTPVSGDRLRTRVLGSRRGDASIRTLNNVASALRRSLGQIDGTPRLLPVGPQGMYRAFDITSDIEQFLTAVEDGQVGDIAVRRATLTRALELIRGEPLSGEPRGYEWFLAEGHLHRVQRSVEKAVVELLEIADATGDTALSWFARDAMRRFDTFHPLATTDEGRLGEFRRDGLGRT